MSQLSQGNKSFFSFTMPGSEDLMRVVKFTGQEGLSQPFRFDLQLALESDEVLDLLQPGAAATLRWLDSTGKVARLLNAIIDTVVLGHFVGRFRLASIRLVPWLQRLALRRNSRVFARQTVADTLQQVLVDAGISRNQYYFDLQNDYPLHASRVQYQESDLDFICRLMEAEGIYFLFEHEAENHILKICDRGSSGIDLIAASPSVLNYQPPVMSGAIDAADIFPCRQLKSLTTEALILQRHDWRQRQSVQEVTAGSASTLGLESIEYAGEFLSLSAGKLLAERCLQADRQAAERYIGRSRDLTFQPGSKFLLQQHPLEYFNRELLVVAVLHHARQTQVLEEHAQAVPAAYESTLHCVGGDLDFVPARTRRKPRINGIQTATVVGCGDDHVYTDEFGRVKLKFHWDRRSVCDEADYAWVRVAQAWAGNRWGSLFLPRPGQEVVVSFIDGDPDQPIVTGGVYNAVSMPPFILPDNKTCSVIRSDGAGAAGNSNEIRMNDRSGEERLYMHGQKDIATRAENDLLEYVGNEHHLLVRQNAQRRVEGDRHCRTCGDESHQIDGSLSVGSSGEIQVRARGNFGLQCDDDMHVLAGDRMVIESSTDLTLKAGSSFVRIDAGGITLSGKMIRLNSGGSAGIGRGVSVDAPLAPREIQADGIDAVNQGSAPEPVQAKSPAARVLEQAARDGTAFCEQCSDC